MGEVFWHSHEGNFTENAQNTYSCHKFLKFTELRLQPHLPGANTQGGEFPGRTLTHWSPPMPYIAIQNWVNSDSEAGPWFNIKMTSYQYRISHCGDKTILRPSYLHNGISYTGKMTSLYWIGALDQYLTVTNVLTNWGQVMHICVSKLSIIASDNGLATDQCQAIIWTNVVININEILIEIHTFSFKCRLRNVGYFVLASMCSSKFEHHMMWIDQMPVTLLTSWSNFKFDKLSSI